MNKTDFWTGAIVGAAAAVLLSNKKVQNKLAQIASSTEETLKSNGENLKEAAIETASSAKENINASSEILKEAIQEYIEKHGADLVEEATDDKKTTTKK